MTGKSPATPGSTSPGGPAEGAPPATQPAGAAPTLTLRGKPVLVATDFGEAAGAAARLGAALAAARGAVPHAVHVIDTSGIAVPPSLLPAIAAADALIGEAAHESQERDVRERIARVLGAPVEWPVRVAVGAPARAIAAEAARIGAALVVLGLSRHTRLQRAFGDETTLNVMRAGVAPVLGVAASMRALPRTAVVGVDLGRAGAYAARAAVELLDDGGKLVLAHAAVRRPGRESDGGERLVGERGAAASLQQLIAALDVPAGIVVEPVVIDVEIGTTAAAALLSLADRAGAELVAAGAHRAGRVQRFILGSVTADLVRPGRHSVLVVPPER